MDGERQAALIASLTAALPSLRACLHLTQAELGEVLGVTSRTVYCMESGQRTMSWTMFLALVYFFSLHRAAHPLLAALGISGEELEALMRRDLF